HPAVTKYGIRLLNTHIPSSSRKKQLRRWLPSTKNWTSGLLSKILKIKYSSSTISWPFSRCCNSNCWKYKADWGSIIFGYPSGKTNNYIMAYIDALQRQKTIFLTGMSGKRAAVPFHAGELRDAARK